MQKRIIAFCLVVIFAVMPLLYSCGDKANEKNASEDVGLTEKDTGNEEESTAPTYEYPTLDMGGRDFRILNSKPVWNFTTAIVAEEETEDVLNDAIFNRNKFIEDQFNINMVEIPVDINSIAASTKKAVQAGDDIYDIIYCPRAADTSIGGLITSGYFYNLDNIPEINLSGNYWKAASIEMSRLGVNNGIYFLQSEVPMMTLQGVWCLFFNETMMGDLGLDLPYQLVRDGKWTLDEFLKYVKAGAQLNGDESFKWNTNGTSIYGLTAPIHSMAAFIIGINEPFIRKDENNMPYLGIENEHFYNGINKILEITSVEGQFIEANEDRNTSGKNYEIMFENGRSLFIIAEFKTADLFRSMEQSYAIVPMPKYDESQENYNHLLFSQCPVITIPQTNTIPHETGIIIDALEFKSHTEVTPVYYDISLSFKGLRNDESIEMMHIINGSIALDLGMTYDWTRTLYDNFNDAISKGTVNVASLIEKRKDAISKSIDKTVTLLEEMESRLN